MKSKSALITDILLACKAGGCYMGGDILFALVFRTEAELKKIAQTLNIKIEKN